ncbi:MAG: hypothetical protein KF825_13230 [Ferruginibacter sp.]|nr:hypothetical protein [Ferruginibacter sp.]
MNIKVKRFIQSLMVNDVSWFVVTPFLYFSRRLEASRINYKNRDIEAENISLCNKIFKEKTVLHGLFKGMKYAGVHATGSSIYAKLLGSYESEISQSLQNLLKKEYTNFINIGCDEGYYAVGIALLYPNSKVFAFDCNKKAQESCKTLARINNVANNITVMGCFDSSKLPKIDTTSKNLFIIDCEGCENEIFTAKMLAATKHADLIIELHYMVNPEVLSKLQSIFSATHKLSLINALSDYERVMNYKFAELDNLSYQQKDFILNERNGFMQWLIAEAIS